MKQYRRIIPACDTTALRDLPAGAEPSTLPVATEEVFTRSTRAQKHGLVYHMTTTQEWLTVEQVAAEMRVYQQCWPEDTSEAECTLEVVQQALEELAAVGLEEVR